MNETTKAGGYCSKCDTVWSAPGRCRCIVEIVDGIAKICSCQQPIIEYGRCSNCRGLPRSKDMECVGIEKETKEAITRVTSDNVYAKQIWNEAIEAAAMCKSLDIFAAIEIRKLKK